MTESWLVTGAMGCLGAWVTRLLVEEGASVALFDASSDDRRLRLMMDDRHLSVPRRIVGDLTDEGQVARAVEGVTHVVHLAALQLPFCRAEPALGAAVNVTGTVNLFEAARQHAVEHVAFASSVAVYGPPDEYESEIMSADAVRRPTTLYGAYKVANEDTAKVYWLDHGVPSIGLRPHTVYGPGRDQGLTSQPTAAILAAVRNQPFHIDYGGSLVFQHARDIASLFIQAARARHQGAEVLNVGGAAVSVADFVAEVVAATGYDDISCGGDQLALPRDIDGSRLIEVLGPAEPMTLSEGIAATVLHFQDAIAAGRPLPAEAT